MSQRTPTRSSAGENLVVSQKLSFTKTPELTGLVSQVTSIVKLPQQFTINEVIDSVGTPS